MYTCTTLHYTYSHTYISTCTHTCTRTRTHTLMCSLSLSFTHSLYFSLSHSLSLSLSLSLSSPLQLQFLSIWRVIFWEFPPKRCESAEATVPKPLPLDVPPPTPHHWCTLSAHEYEEDGDDKPPPQTWTAVGGVARGGARGGYGSDLISYKNPLREQFTEGRWGCFGHVEKIRLSNLTTQCTMLALICNVRAFL